MSNRICPSYYLRGVPRAAQKHSHAMMLMPRIPVFALVIRPTVGYNPTTPTPIARGRATPHTDAHLLPPLLTPLPLLPVDSQSNPTLPVPSRPSQPHPHTPSLPLLLLQHRALFCETNLEVLLLMHLVRRLVHLLLSRRAEQPTF
eukprot:2817461-Prymnesium_polylepis.2